MIPAKGFEPSLQAARRHRRIGRALADLRRGLPVVIDAGQGALLAHAAEHLDTPALATLREAARRDGSGQAEVRTFVTAARAAVLHIKRTGHAVVGVRVTPDMDARTLRDLADPATDLERPLIGPFEWLREPPGEAALAAVKLAKLAQLLPAMVVAATEEAADSLAGRLDLIALDPATVLAHDDHAARSLKPLGQPVRLPLHDAAQARIQAFRPADGGPEHLAVVVGNPDRQAPVLARIHSECFTGDLLGSMRCDCGEQLRGAIRQMDAAGGGVLLYLAQEGRGIGLINKLRAYRIQDQGFDTVEANLRIGFDADERVFLPAAEMLRLLGFEAVRLLTNNPEKVAGLEACGVTVAERVPLAFAANAHNELYLDTKRKKSGHYL